MKLMINPSAPLRNETEARAAARASAIAIFIGVLMGIVTVAMMMNGGLTDMEAAMKAQAGSDPNLAGMTGAVAQGTLYFTIFLVLVQAVLGFVQWAKPNVFIPILFLILVVYGLGISVLALISAGDQSAPQSMMNTPAVMIASIVVMLIQALLHAVGIRGATALSKFQRGEVSATA